MPPSKSKRIVRATLAVFALAGIVGALALVERSNNGPGAGGINAQAAAAFEPSGDTGAAFEGDLSSFVGNQFGDGALKELTPSERAEVSALFSAGQAISGNPGGALRGLNAAPGSNSNRAIFQAIRNSVFSTLRAAMRGCRDNGVGICAKILAKINQMAGRGGGGGGGGGTS